MKVFLKKREFPYECGIHSLIDFKKRRMICSTKDKVVPTIEQQ